MSLEAITDTAPVYREAAENRPVKSGDAAKSLAAEKTGNPITITEEVTREAAGRKEGKDKEKTGGEPTEKKIRDAVSQANNKMKAVRTGCEFSYHQETNRICIKVYDRDTKEVIREIPPDKILNMVEKVWELAGILVDEKL